MGENRPAPLLIVHCATTRGYFRQGGTELAVFASRTEEEGSRTSTGALLPFPIPGSPFFHLPDFFDQLRDLLALAAAHIQEANADRAPVVDGLDDTAEPEWQPFKVEFGFYTRVDAHGKSLVGADAATAGA